MLWLKLSNLAAVLLLGTGSTVYTHWLFCN